LIFFRISVFIEFWSYVLHCFLYFIHSFLSFLQIHSGVYVLFNFVAQYYNHFFISLSEVSSASLSLVFLMRELFSFERVMLPRFHFIFLGIWIGISVYEAKSYFGSFNHS
jgi:hypothetical protein